MNLLFGFVQNADIIIKPKSATERIEKVVPAAKEK